MGTFKVGDKVRVIKNRTVATVGMVGVICRIEPPDTHKVNIGVDFGVDMGGHGCNNYCTFGHGYFLKPEELELVIEEGKPEPTEDIVNKPDHYHKGGIDVLTYVEGKVSKEEMAGFYRINVLKYVTRYKEKNGVEDLKKAQFYLNKLIELES